MFFAVEQHELHLHQVAHARLLVQAERRQLSGDGAVARVFRIEAAVVQHELVADLQRMRLVRIEVIAARKILQVGAGRPRGIFEPLDMHPDVGHRDDAGRSSLINCRRGGFHAVGFGPEIFDHLAGHLDISDYASGHRVGLPDEGFRSGAAAERREVGGHRPAHQGEGLQPVGSRAFDIPVFIQRIVQHDNTIGAFGQ